MSTPANQQYGTHHNGGTPPSTTHGGLPFTGFDVGYLAIPGFAMIVLGIVIYRWFGKFTDDPPVNKLS